MKRFANLDYKWLALLTVSIGSFMSTLDSSIVNISFPRLTEVFHTDPSVVLWVSVAYLLVSVGLMLSVGRLGDVFGRKKFYCVGFAIFTVGLGLCSISQSIVQLIAARVVQGVGAAMTISLGTAIVTAAFPGQERGKSLGILSSVVSAGLLSGPVFGGLLLDTLGWRAVFFIRIPVGLLGLLMAWLILKEGKEKVTNFRFDIGGTATLFAGLSALLLFFNLGARSGFLSPAVLAMGTSSVISLILFIMIERRVSSPVVDLQLFRNRAFAGGNISLGIVFLAQASIVFLMPFYLMQGLGESASTAGLLIAITSGTSLLVAPVSGWLSDRQGPRLLCTMGVALVCLALFLLSRLSIDSGHLTIAARLVVLGIGIGLFSSPNNSAIMGSVPRDKLSTGSAMLATVRQIGMSTGVAIAGTIFASRQLFHAASLADEVVNPDILSRLAIIGGFEDTLVIATIISAVAIFASMARGKHQKTLATTVSQLEAASE